MKPKLVIINWEDAVTSTSRWTHINDIDNDLAAHISIGLVIWRD